MGVGTYKNHIANLIMRALVAVKLPAVDAVVQENALVVAEVVILYALHVVEMDVAKIVLDMELMDAQPVKKLGMLSAHYVKASKNYCYSPLKSFTITLQKILL